MEEIVNKVANSVLEVFDLEDYYPNGTRTQIDISQWLYEGFLLREKDFREALKNEEKNVRKKLQKKPAAKVKVDKDW